MYRALGQTDNGRESAGAAFSALRALSWLAGGLLFLAVVRTYRTSR